MNENTYYLIVIICVAVFAVLQSIKAFIQSRKYFQLTVDGETFQVVFNLSINRWNKTITFTDPNYAEHTMVYSRIKICEIQLKE